jgi:hypothetical protein
MKNDSYVKVILLLLTLILLLPGCGNKSSGVINEITLKSEINQVISDWHKSAAMSDHKAYIGAMADSGVYIGTDATEYWTTPEFSAWSKPYFDQAKGWNLVSLQRNIYLANNRETAWFDELLDTGMGLCRGSGVLQKTEGQWQIFHYVLSPTIPNDLINEVKSLKAKDDSLIIQNLVPVPAL